MIRYAITIILSIWMLMTHASLVMELDSHEATQNDTIRLSLSLDNPQSNAQPDLTPLEKDFIITGTATQMTYTVINGVAHSTKQWTILLVAKKQGILPIPSIQVGYQRSPATSITITQNTQHSKHNTPSDTTHDDAVMLHTKLDKQSAFINEQIIYTVTLYSRAPLLNADYQAPKVDGGLFFPIGNGRRYHTTIKGYGYDVDEQQYAIYPQKSGLLEITPPEFNAVVYGMQPQPIHLNGNSISIPIKPIPTTHTTEAWLPAKNITLIEQFDNTNTVLDQGASLVRTLTLEAIGLPAELLPTLELKNSSQFNVYPEQAVTKNTLNQQELTGTRTLKVTYLLNHAGTITLPAIQLLWFNTQTQTYETATLPEHTVTVIAKKKSAAITLKKNQMTPVMQHPLQSKTTLQSFHKTIIITIGGLVALLVLIGLRHYLKHTAAKRTTRKKLHHACMTHHATQTKHALLEWAAQTWPNATFLNLNDIIKHTDDRQLKTLIEELIQALYSPSNTIHTWRGHALWQKITTVHPSPSHHETPSDQDLPPINP